MAPARDFYHFLTTLPWLRRSLAAEIAHSPSRANCQVPKQGVRLRAQFGGRQRVDLQPSSRAHHANAKPTPPRKRISTAGKRVELGPQPG
jgi:hypothetical protein